MNLYLGVSVFFLILVQFVLPTKAQSCGHTGNPTLIHTWFDTRLVGGERDFEGRVEVFLNNSWRSLCDQAWDRVKVDVVCEGLGYGYAVSVVTGSGFGPGTGEIYRGRYECYGNEKNIGCCDLLWVLREDQCSNSTEAGVVCSGSNVTKGSLRFADGHSNPYQGRLEMYNGSHWGTICHSGWTESDARVACSQMGFPGVAQTLFYTSGGGSSQPIWFSDVQCSGNESSLLECSVNRNHSCTHATDVGVKCSLSDVTKGSLRFADGRSNPYQGRLEMYNGSHWGTICHSGWTESDARVACGQMGFPGVAQTLFYTSGGGSSQPIWFSDVQCSGNESSLLECSVNRNHSCTHATDVGVKCSLSADTVPATPMNMSVRLAGGRTDYQGRVEVYRDNQWKLVCGSKWDQNEGDVVCRQLGLGYAVATTNKNYFFKGSGSVWNVSISCTGSERTLGECSVTPPPTSSYFLSDSVFVFCSGKHLASGSIRFVSSYFQGAVGGRLEVFLNNEWGTICNSGWDRNDARVACKELGFLSVNIDKMSIGGGGFYQKFWMKNVNCQGNESQLVNCNYTSAKGCYHGDDDISIDCFNSVRHSVRLVGGKNKSEGYVQVFGNYSWTSICTDEFDMADATVTCRELGYNYATAVVNDGRFSRDELGMEQFDLAFDCSGNEQRLWECPRIYSPGCILGRDLVGVVCSQTSGGTMDPPVTSAPSDNAAALLGAIVGGVVGGVFFLMLVVVIVVILITVAVCLCTRGRKSTHHYSRVQMINM